MDWFVPFGDLSVLLIGSDPINMVSGPSPKAAEPPGYLPDGMLVAA